MSSSQDVQKLVKSKLRGYKFLIVSNREPYLHMHTPDGVRVKTPAGGLTAALDPLMQATGGTWVAGGSGDADRECVDKQNRCRVPPDKPKYVLKRVWMSKDEVDKFYFGFSNQTLWPLCHNVFREPVFEESFWKGYKHSNALYAEAIKQETRGIDKAFIWFHDYHLALTPKMVRNDTRKKQKLVLAQFWHIPWPTRDIFALLPWAEEVLEGMLANDLIGFHLPSYCFNFLASVENILGIKADYRRFNVKYQGRTIQVKPFPISVDFDAIDKIARVPGVKQEMKRVRAPQYIPYKYIGVGVDRIDYTKGIIQRFRAIDRFLEKYPEYQNNFVFVEAGAPSRNRIPAYMKLNEEISKIVGKINWKYLRGYWKPIIYIEGKLDLNRLFALYRTADVCIVSPIQDGMNLVAKEFISANVDSTGVLMLSKFAGATEELKDAVIVNPYDVEGFADAIRNTLEMSPKEKRRRMKNLRDDVKKNNVFKWLSDFICESAKFIS
ncbi:MAG: trehalose-6-phosphate synthase [Hadesarchaea archaeon]|nr:MAG: trehalose-6-phosphate synthase [Hadesarchaea archaeon]